MRATRREATPLRPFRPAATGASRRFRPVSGTEHGAAEPPGAGGRKAADFARQIHRRSAKGGFCAVGRPAARRSRHLAARGGEGGEG